MRQRPGYGTMTTMAEERWEDRHGTLGRQLSRAVRRARWQLKGAAGVPRSILVELRWRLGDEIMALPIFEALRLKYPVARIEVLTNYPELFENHPFVDAVNPLAPNPDRYLLLRSATRNQLRIAHYAAVAGVDLPVWRPHLFLNDWHTPLLVALPAGDGPLVALAPGASWATKRWRTERWRVLAERLHAAGARLMVLGHADERLNLDAGEDFTGRTGVRDAACLLHAADLLVCCDSGLMHLALAATTPVVALFGPTDPELLIQNEPNFHPLRSTASCSGLWNRSGSSPEPGVCPEGHDSCLDSITVDAVFDAVARAVVLPGVRG